MVTSTSAAGIGNERLRAWWSDGSGGLPLYRELRGVAAERWEAALDGLPADDGPEPVPPPDRPPARSVDLPEVLALRAQFHDDGTPFDTAARLMQALTQSVIRLDDRRPLIWTADDVARRCVQIVGGGETNLWSTLEVVREFWAWHPDRPFVEHQGGRLLVYLDAVLAGDGR